MKWSAIILAMSLFSFGLFAQSDLFDPGARVTVEGEVVEVQQMSPPGSQGYGQHVILKTSGGEIPVHLGPTDFLHSIDLRIDPKDQLKVIGSKATEDGKSFVIAIQVERNGEQYILRDNQGVPVWSRAF